MRRVEKNGSFSEQKWEIGECAVYEIDFPNGFKSFYCHFWNGYSFNNNPISNYNNCRIRIWFLLSSDNTHLQERLIGIWCWFINIDLSECAVCILGSNLESLGNCQIFVKFFRSSYKMSLVTEYRPNVFHGKYYILTIRHDMNGPVRKIDRNGDERYLDRLFIILWLFSGLTIPIHSRWDLLIEALAQLLCSLPTPISSTAKGVSGVNIWTSYRHVSLLRMSAYVVVPLMPERCIWWQ